jgi:F0F1-type ATP synthase epsilon subunit
MKLKEFLEVALLGKEDNPNLTNGTFVDVTCLYGYELVKYKNIIKECDEFTKCDSLEILSMPLVKGKKDKIYTAETIKLSDLMEFKGKCYLLSLSLIPEMYDPNQLLKPVKNGAAMGPTIYDPSTFEPRKHILLTWSPEMVQDLSGTNDEVTLKNNIHKLLDDVLDNPDEYKTKGTRYVLVRGLFEVIDDGGNTVINEYDIDLKKNESDANESKERLDNILKKNKELEDRISAEEKYMVEVNKLMKLKKEGKK